ncbi:hypothetical protein [Rubripirellula lacrimiformis]|nr:hypothetical protein [Rubripirellula lacrimiformis]
MNAKPQFGLRAFIAATTFLCCFLAGVFRNVDALRSDWPSAAIATARTYAIFWLCVLSATIILMPVLYRLRIYTIAWIFMVAACLLMLANFLLPLGQL